LVVLVLVLVLGLVLVLVLVLPNDPGTTEKCMSVSTRIVAHSHEFDLPLSAGLLLVTDLLCETSHVRTNKGVPFDTRTRMCNWLIRKKEMMTWR
jgi:hypothetical protein